MRNAEAAERSLQGEIAREIRRRWRVAHMGDKRQTRRDGEIRMRQRSRVAGAFKERGRDEEGAESQSGSGLRGEMGR